MSNFLMKGVEKGVKLKCIFVEKGKHKAKKKEHKNSQNSQNSQNSKMTSVTANTMVQKALVGLVREVVTAQSKQYGFDVAEAMGRLEVKMASGRKTASEKEKEATIREQKATIRSLQKELKAANSGHTKALQQVEKLRMELDEISKKESEAAQRSKELRSGAAALEGAGPVHHI